MFNTIHERLSLAHRNRRRAAHVRDKLLAAIPAKDAAKELLRHYAKWLESAARDIERRVVSSRRQNGHF